MDGITDLKRIVEHARQMGDPDILCLQEVSAHMPDLADTNGADQFGELAALLPQHTAIAGTPLEIFDPHGKPRRFGNAIFSRLPVRQVLRHTLPWIPDGERNMPRGVIEATVIAPFGPLRVMTTHLEYFSAQARAAQVDAIRAIHAAAYTRSQAPPDEGKGPYESTPRPAAALLMGDFNMPPSHPTKRRISDKHDNGAPRLIDAWSAVHDAEPHPNSFCITDQTYGQPHCCDFMFVSEGLTHRIGEVVYDTETRLSDHQPVVLTLE